MKNEAKASTMNDQNEGGLKPKLRFPQFRDAPPWEETKLEDLISTITPPKKLPTSDYLAEGLFPIIDQSQDYLCGWTNDDAALVKESPPLVVFGDHTCVIKLTTQPFAQGADGIKIFKATHGVSTQYLYHFLNFRPLAMEDYKRHFSILKERRVFYSDINLGEQQKISECLSSLDELIEAHGRRLDALKAHKRGLMQQLFPREGETKPRLRFPEFQSAGEWEKKKLEDLAKRGSGHTPNKAKEEYYNGGIKWVSLADSKRLDNGFISDTEIEISELGIEHSSAVLRPAGSVILSRDAGVGKSAIMGVSMAVSQHFIVWTCDSDQLSNWFLYYTLQKKKPLFERVATGSTIKTIGLPFFIEMCIKVPLLPEQQRIADCLSSLDDIIAAQTQKLDTLKAHKKGLMQQLFPSSDEVEA